MRLILTIPDDVADAYAARVRPSQTLEQVLAIQLERFQAVDPRDRILIVDPAARARLEELTTRLPLTTTEELCRRVGELAALEIGRIRIPWTPAQWREIQARAERWRVTPAEYATRIVRQIAEQFFSERLRELQAPAAAPGSGKGA